MVTRSRDRSRRARQQLPVHFEGDPVRVVPAQQVVERGIEQRLEVAADGFFEIAGVEKRRQADSSG